jgi:hypothetical protein
MVLCVYGPIPRKGRVVRLWRTGCDKWYQPTLAVARRGQYAGIWRMTRVGIRRRHWTCGPTLRGDVPGYGPVRGHIYGARRWTYIRRVGPIRTSSPLGGVCDT